MPLSEEGRRRLRASAKNNKRAAGPHRMTPAGVEAIRQAQARRWAKHREEKRGLNAEQKKILRQVRRKVVLTHWVKYSCRVLRYTSYEQKKRKVCGCLNGLVNMECKSKNVFDVSCPLSPRSDRGAIVLALTQAMRARHDGYYFSLVHFNDAPMTSREDVLAVIDMALRGEGA